MTEHDGDVIRSADNRTLKFVRSLRQRKSRDAERAFVVEGVRAVRDALGTGAAPRLLLLRDGDPTDIDVTSIPGAVRRVAPALFNQVAETEHPQPLLAVFSIPDHRPDLGGDPLIVVADGIQDPGNLGTLLRSAAAVGAAGVFFTLGTVDPYNGKVVRAGMGAHFRIPLLPLDATWTARLRERCPTRVLAEADGSESYDEISWAGPTVLVIGSEAHGPGPEGTALATVRARIPLENGVESLNAGVAASVLLFEAARQRRSAQSH